MSNFLGSLQSSQQVSSGYVKFEGITDDGKQLTVEGPAHNIRNNFQAGVDGNRTQCVFDFDGPSKLCVGQTVAEGDVEIRFGVTNFDFIGTDWEEIKPKSFHMNTLKINLGSRAITIRRVNDYDERLSRLKMQKQVEITCEIIFVTNIADLSDSFELVEALCNLLSIARGRKINWLYFCIATDDQIIYIEHQPRVVGPYSTLELIDHMPPEDTRDFVETCYQYYIERNPVFKFHNIVNSFTDVRTNGFIETL